MIEYEAASRVDSACAKSAIFGSGCEGIGFCYQTIGTRASLFLNPRRTELAGCSARAHALVEESFAFAPSRSSMASIRYRVASVASVLQ